MSLDHIFYSERIVVHNSWCLALPCYAHFRRNCLVLLTVLLGSLGCEKHEPARVIATAPDRMQENSDAGSYNNPEVNKLYADFATTSVDAAPVASTFSTIPSGESTAKPANSAHAVKVVGWRMTSDMELPGKRPQAGETVFVVVDTRIPASVFWERVGDDFYNGSARSAKLLSPKGKTYNADAWALEADAQFTENSKSAYIPNGPVDDEAVRFAFFVSVDSVGMPSVHIQYGDSAIVELTDSNKTN